MGMAENPKKKVENMILLNTEARLARIPVSDLAASLFNGELPSKDEIQRLASSCTESEDEMRELLDQSRIIIWKFSNGQIYISRACGMSMSDMDIVDEIGKMVKNTYPDASCQFPETINLDGCSIDLGNGCYFSSKNVSAMEILENRQ